LYMGATVFTAKKKVIQKMNLTPLPRLIVLRVLNEMR
jgi:hypothetical protein